MKQIIFIVILIFAFRFQTFFQVEGEVPQCPTINVIGPAEIIEPSEPITFTSEFSENFENTGIEYIWTVEGGKIIEGQGTKSIKALMDECGRTMTATLAVKGLPPTCYNSASETFAISRNCQLTKSILIDGYEKITIEEEKIKIDSFLLKLQKEITAEGVIEFPNDKDLIRHLKWIHNYLTAKEVDKTRISYAISDSRKGETWLWLVPPSDELPDCYNCLVIKAEDSDELNKMLKSKSKNHKK